MRIRLPIGRTAFAAVAFLFALAALLPLRLALDWMGFAERGLSARAATGSLWFGALQDARAGPVPLGDVTARLHLLPLFLGRARLTIASPEPDVGVEGALTVSRHGFALDGADGRIRAGALFSPIPIASLELDDFSAGFASTGCARAAGRVRAVVAGELAALGLGSAFEGVPRCDGEALLLPLATRTGMEQIHIRILGDGRYRLDLLVRPTDPAIGARLAAAGMRPVGRGYGLRIEGAF